MKYNRSLTEKEYNSKRKIDFLFFWGHRAQKDGSIGKGVFSQWWICDFEVEGIKYTSTEQYMMAGKARLFGDDKILNKILAESDPHNIKKLGRLVDNFNGKVWDESKYEIVKDGNLHKFSQNSNLKEFLISTGQRVLVEASPYDKIWGIGMKQDNPTAKNPYKWKGENLLGFALMEVRDMLKG